jgi:hypothetical protein
MKLTKTFGQYKPGTGASRLQSAFCIEVDYNVEENTVEEILRVYSINYDNNVETDLTAVFCEIHSRELDRIIDSVDWRLEFREMKADKRAA